MSTELERHKKALDVALAVLEVCSRRMGTQSFNESVKRDIDSINAILSPPPEMEEVELVRWLNPDTGDVRDANFHIIPPNYVKLTGTLKRPKPQPVEKSCPLTVTDQGWIADGLDIVGVDLPLVGTFIWTEYPK